MILAKKNGTDELVEQVVTLNGMGEACIRNVNLYEDTENVLINLNVYVNGPIDGSLLGRSGVERFRNVRVPTSMLLHGGAAIFEAFPGINLHLCFGNRIGPHNTVHGDIEMDKAWEEMNTISNKTQQKLFELTVSTELKMPQNQEEVDAILKQYPDLSVSLQAFIALGGIGVCIGDQSMDDKVKSVSCSILSKLHADTRELYNNNRPTMDAVFTLSAALTEIYNMYLDRGGDVLPSKKGFYEWMEKNPNEVEQNLHHQSSLMANGSYRYDQAPDPNVCVVSNGNVTLGLSNETDCQKSDGCIDKAQLWNLSHAIQDMIKKNEFFKKEQTNLELDNEKVALMFAKLGLCPEGDCEDMINQIIKNVGAILAVTPENKALNTHYLQKLKECGNRFPKYPDQSEEVVTPESLSFLASKMPKIDPVIGGAGGANLMQQKPTATSSAEYIDQKPINIKESTQVILEKFKKKLIGGHAYGIVKKEIINDNDGYVFHVGDSAIFKVDLKDVITKEGTAPKLHVMCRQDASILEQHIKMDLSLQTPPNQTNDDMANDKRIGSKFDELNQKNKCVMRQDGINILSNIMGEIVKGHPIITSTQAGGSEKFYEVDLAEDAASSAMITNKGLMSLLSSAQQPNHGIGSKMMSFGKKSSIFPQTGKYLISEKKFSEVFQKEGTLACLRSCIGPKIHRACLKIITEGIGVEGRKISTMWSMLPATESDSENAEKACLQLLRQSCEENGVAHSLPTCRFDSVIDPERRGIHGLIGNPMVIMHSIEQDQRKEYKILPMTAYTQIVAKCP